MPNRLLTELNEKLTVNVNFGRGASCIKELFVTFQYGLCVVCVCASVCCTCNPYQLGIFTSVVVTDIELGDSFVQMIWKR